MLWLLIAVFIIGELLHKFGWQGELTRKVVHVLSGLVVILLPFVWNLPHTLLVGLLFTIILLWSEKNHLFKSVHAVTRPTIGGSLFPLGLSAAAAISWSNPLAFQLSVLILTVSDTLAWIAGQGYLGLSKPKEFRVSLIFGLVTLVIWLLVGWLAGLVSPHFFVAGLFSSLLLSVVEFHSYFGSDNFFIPVVASVLALVVF